MREIIPAGPRRHQSSGGAGRFSDGNRLPRQQRFVGLQIAAVHQHGVCGYPVALREHDDVAAHHVATGDALPLSAADNRGAWTAEVAQRFQHPLRAGFLDDRDHHRKRCENKEDKRFLEIPEDEVDEPAAQQERQHRLAHDLENDAQRRALVWPW